MQPADTVSHVDTALDFDLTMILPGLDADVQPADHPSS